MGTKKRLLIFSCDPGGADCLVPLVKTLKDRYDLLVLSGGTAAGVFQKCARNVIDVGGRSFAAIEALLKNYSMDGVVTSASSLPDKDMTEKLFWKWAERSGIPSIAVLDQWENYALRFSGPHGRSRLGYMPDRICVMDEFARDEMVEEGFPESRICVTGQPALAYSRPASSGKKRYFAQNIARKKKDTFNITFFSQPIKDLFGKSLGYDERTVLGDILLAASLLKTADDLNVKVLCKLHPKNKSEDLALKGSGSCVEPIFIQKERSNEDIIRDSDMVVGVNSIMLIHAILTGVPTISYEPGSAGKKDSFMPVKIAAISRATDAKDLAAVMKKIATNEVFLRSYLKKQERFDTDRSAVDNILRLIDGMFDLPMVALKKENAG